MGATGTPRRLTAAEAMTPQLRGRVAELRLWEARVWDQRPDAVHHVRVATRRLRSALSGFGPLLDRRPTRALSRELRQVAAVLGGGRDAQVVRAQIDTLLGDDADTPEARLHASLTGLLEQADAASRHHALERLGQPSYDAFVRALERFADLPPWLPAADRGAEEVLGPLLADEWSRFLRSADRALTSPHPAREERLHTTRKASKRARYVAESTVVVLGRRARRLAKEAERVQESLGDYRDLVLARDFLAEARHQLPLDTGQALLLTQVLEGQEHAVAARRASAERVLHKVERRKPLRTRSG